MNFCMYYVRVCFYVYISVCVFVNVFLHVFLSVCNLVFSRLCVWFCVHYFRVCLSAMGTVYECKLHGDIAQPSADPNVRVHDRKGSSPGNFLVCAILNCLRKLRRVESKSPFY
jgi:hypothetical protein